MSSMNPIQLAQLFGSHSNLSDIILTNEGEEFAVFKAESIEFGSVALRFPKLNVFQNVNNLTEGEKLLKQELWIYGLLYEGPVPVPKPFRFLVVDDYPAMLSKFVVSDRSPATDSQLGRMTALIHSTTLPEKGPFRLVAQEEQEAVTVLAGRILRRFSELEKEVPSASSWVPHPAYLLYIAEQLKRLDSSCLLHMGLRHGNLRTCPHGITAVTDWSNSMIGPNVVEVFHILELEQPGDEFLQAYTKLHRLPKVTPTEEAFLRLDAALRLALVLISSPLRFLRERQELALARVKQLAAAVSF